MFGRFVKFSKKETPNESVLVRVNSVKTVETIDLVHARITFIGGKDVDVWEDVDEVLEKLNEEEDS